MSKMDTYNLGRMMFHYFLLSEDARRRARVIFKQLLEAAKEDEEKRQAVLRAVGVEVEARSDGSTKQAN